MKTHQPTLPCCLIPQHPLLPRSFWLRLQRSHRLSYWTQVGFHGYQTPYSRVSLRRLDYYKGFSA